MITNAARRTRFLEQLDRMMAQDRQGAIADMLAVLREAGAIKSVYANAKVEEHFLSDEGYRDHLQSQIADMIGRFTLDQKVLKFEEGYEAPFKLIVGKVEVVPPPSV
ncbi:MAG: hypothetical protein E5W41_00070 [Mesorhizobium sp.]|nr:MAG: hypothetical protein E5W41_00070 [Mesorhizobium sp.]